MTELEKEFHEFEKDIEKNIINSNDLNYIKKRTANLIKTVFNEVDKLINYNEQRINNLEDKLEKVEEIVEGIEKDIYLDEVDDIDNNGIICPYCNFEFEIDYDETLKEVECPQCHNIIELDWNGDINEDFEGCNGHCSSCGNCNDENEDDENNL